MSIDLRLPFFDSVTADFLVHQRRHIRQRCSDGQQFALL
jgi:hypothetical protein